MKNLFERLLKCNAIIVGFVVCILATIPTVIISKVLMAFVSEISFGQALAVSFMLEICAICIFAIVGLAVKQRSNW